ncbi:hypothetical protein Gotri_027791 [Gossypium trilobum]|uniref:Uncharacterized protein n=1 Tax=Gossypium trilobum TaxID=34281 RepID=A0A7J9FIM8_9ROSI|nr:hypothetical protein [Gossypium trilobum]
MRLMLRWRHAKSLQRIQVQGSLGKDSS